jgi:hypothetical protein
MIATHAMSGTAGEALVKYRLLKLTGDRTFKYAQPGDTPIGSNEAATASGEPVSVHLLQRLGSLELMADGVIAQNARVYVGLNGKVSAAGVGPAIGHALTASLADGNVIEVLPAAVFGLGSAGDVVELFDDFFFHDTTEGPFDTTADAGASGTTDVIDGAGGIMSLVCDGDDNDEAYLHTIVEAFKFAAAKPLFFEARVAITEGATNAAAAIIGMLDAAGADALLDTEGGPKASYSGVVFYKVAGGLTWSAEASIAGAQTPIPLAGATYASGTFYKYGILVVPTTSALANVYLFINDVLVGSLTDWTYTNATDMDLIVGVKSNGSAEETALVDYIHCRQAR